MVAPGCPLSQAKQHFSPHVKLYDYHNIIYNQMVIRYVKTMAYEIAGSVLMSKIWLKFVF
jgi:hypothetical protein